MEMIDRLEAAAARTNTRIEAIHQNELSIWMITLVQELPSYEGWVTVHYDGDLQDALDRLIVLFEAVPDAATEEFDIMNIYKSKLFKYITGDMVKDAPATMTVRDVRMEKVEGGGGRGAEEKPVIYFEKSDKGAILNKTNAKALAAEFGGETDAWRGKQVRLFAEPGTWFGVTGHALRMMPIVDNGNGRAPVTIDDVPFDADDINEDLGLGQ